MALLNPIMPRNNPYINPRIPENLVHLNPGKTDCDPCIAANWVQLNPVKPHFNTYMPDNWPLMKSIKPNVSVYMRVYPANFNVIEPCVYPCVFNSGCSRSHPPADAGRIV